jgi:hypothetical protein
VLIDTGNIGATMTTEDKLRGLAIGAAGELLVQYQLLKRGIDSSRLTTDSGIDLVMYVPITTTGTTTAYTIQVKTKGEPDHAGGTGKLVLGFKFPDACPAQWLAFADLSRDAVWLLTIDEARRKAPQHSANAHKLYWYTDETVSRRSARTLVESQMVDHRLEVVVDKLLRPRYAD